MLAIGHSHLQAWRRAAERLVRQGDDVPAITCVSLQEKADDPAAKSVSAVPSGDELAALIDAAMSGERPTVTFAPLLGNEYNAMVLARHPVPFDFILSERPDLIPEEGCELVPEGALIGTLRARISRSVVPIITALAEITQGPVFLVPPPPPVPDEEHIKAYPSKFGARLQRLGVSPVQLRVKMWLLNRRVLADIAREAKIELMPLPPEIFDSQGCLLKRYWNRDPTHGNVAYGEVLLMDAVRRVREMSRAGEMNNVRDTV